jgi:5-formyltetrahydrofolate cyclo-ligase
MQDNPDPDPDPTQATDIARWRKAERQRLLDERAAMSVAVRHDASVTIADHIDRLLGSRFESLDGLTISAWWPIKAELNLRHWLTGLAMRGARAALRGVSAGLWRRLFRPHTGRAEPAPAGHWGRIAGGANPDDPSPAA